MRKRGGQPNNTNALKHGLYSPRFRSSDAREAQNPISASLCANCPVLADAGRISDLTQDLQRAMRKLRRDLDRCKTCAAGESCPVLQDYQGQITEAIASVLAELQHRP